VTRTEWQDEHDALAVRLEPFTHKNAQGEREISRHPAVARFAAAYDRIMQYGLERGWVTDAARVLA